MNASYEYFMKEDLSKYAGDWVIIVREKIVAHGSRDHMAKMLKQIRQTHRGEPLFIAKVPEKTVQIV